MWHIVEKTQENYVIITTMIENLRYYTSAYKELIMDLYFFKW